MPVDVSHAGAYQQTCNRQAKEVADFFDVARRLIFRKSLQAFSSIRYLIELLFCDFRQPSENGLMHFVRICQYIGKLSRAADLVGLVKCDPDTHAQGSE